MKKNEKQHTIEKSDNPTSILKPLIPHLIIILGFIALAFLYFLPVLEGKDLPQSDSIHATGMAQELVNYKNETGKSALWTNSAFSGMPAYQIKAAPTYNIYNYMARAMKLGLPYFTVAIIFLYLLGFYLMLISMRIDPWLSALGAIAFAFASYNFMLVMAGHVTKAYALAVMPLVIAGIVMTYRKKYLYGGIFTAIALGLEIAANHVQITYYIALMVMVLVIAEFIAAILKKEIKSFLTASGVLVIAAMLAVAPNITNLWTTYEYGEETIRGKSELTNKQGTQDEGLDKDYALSWSYGHAETFTLLIPNAAGGESAPIGNNKELLDDVSPEYAELVASQSQYWGSQPFTGGPVYFGAIICFLFILGLGIVKNQIKWWLLAITILSIFLAWGKNFPAFTDFFFYNVPLYNKFRTVAMALVIAGFAFPMLAVLAIKEIIDDPEILKKKKIAFYTAFGLTAGISLIFYLMPSTFFDFMNQEEANAILSQKKQMPQYASQLDAFSAELLQVRISLFKADAIRSFIFIALAAGLLWVFAMKKMKYAYFILGITVLVLFDLWMIDKRCLSNDDFISKRNVVNHFTKTPADEIILKDTSDHNFRVMNISRNPFTEVYTSYFHKSIGGYHGAKLRRYQDMIDSYLMREIQALQGVAQKIKPEEQGNYMVVQEMYGKMLPGMKILNMLNMKYLIANPDMFPIVNMYSMGNAWFVTDYQIVNNADEEIVALGTFNPIRTAVIDKRYKEVIDKLPKGNIASDSATIKLVQYAPDNLKYKSDNINEQLAVFSEIYYNNNKGWKAYIDDKPVEHIRVNYILRGLIIPAGKHTIEFKFEPASYYTAQTISLVSSILILMILIAAAAQALIKMRKQRNLSSETKQVA